MTTDTDKSVRTVSYDGVDTSVWPTVHVDGHGPSEKHGSTVTDPSGHVRYLSECVCGHSETYTGESWAHGVLDQHLRGVRNRQIDDAAERERRDRLAEEDAERRARYLRRPQPRALIPAWQRLVDVLVGACAYLAAAAICFAIGGLVFAGYPDRIAPEPANICALIVLGLGWVSMMAGAERLLRIWRRKF